MSITAETLWENISKVKSNSPLVHNITNFVVMNNTANALLALGASPVMAHAEEEVEDMVKISGSLVINIGTLSAQWVSSMEKAMKMAKSLNKQIVLDPVGAGATSYRTQTVHDLLSKAAPTIIRGNASEIQALHMADVQTKGVDSTISSDSAIDAARALSKDYDCAVCISGKIDHIVHGERYIRIENGVELLTKVTGMGCTATSLIGAFSAINLSPVEAAACGMATIGIASEMAMFHATGPGTLQAFFLDALYNISEEDVKTRLKICD